jgi:hypothetical protein
MKHKSSTNSPKDIFFKKVAMQKVEKAAQNTRPPSKDTLIGRHSLETLKKKRDPHDMDRSSSSVKPSEITKHRAGALREVGSQELTSGRNNVAIYSEQFRMKSLPFAYKEFERSYSRLKMYLDRLSVAGEKVPFYRQSLPAPPSKDGLDKKQGHNYRNEISQNGKPIAASTTHNDKDSPQSIQAITVQSKTSHLDDATEDLINEYRLQEEKLEFLLTKMNFSNSKKLAKEPLEVLKKAFISQKEIEREESHTMFVSLNNENHRLMQKIAHLENDLETEGASHKETLHNFEEKIGQLNDKINELHRIIIEKDKTLAACNEKLRLNNLEQVMQIEGQPSSRQGSNNSKSIFEDFDGVIKSLLSDIKAKEDYLVELRENREVSYKEAIASDINQLVHLNTNLKSNHGTGKDDLIYDVHHLQEEMRNLVSKHAKENVSMQQNFEKELNILRTKHIEEKEILEIKVKALEQELREKKPFIDQSPSSVIDELQRKYQNAVAEVSQLKEFINRMHKSHSKSNNSQESDAQKLNPTSKRSSPLEGSNNIPSAVLAESKCIFDSISEESPSVIRAITEALKAREQEILVREEELRNKEQDLNVKLDQTEKWAKNAEILINQKIQEINEAREDVDLRAREVLEREKKIFERDVATESKRTSTNSSEQLSHRTKPNLNRTDDESSFLNGSERLAQGKQIEQMKEQLNLMVMKVIDLEKALHAERQERERDRADLKLKSEELAKIVGINSILITKLKELGYQYDIDQKAFILYHGNS